MRSDSMSEMVESFVDRSDRLYYRRVIFGKPESVTNDNENYKLVRPILVRLIFKLISGILINGIQIFFMLKLFIFYRGNFVFKEH